MTSPTADWNRSFRLAICLMLPFSRCLADQPGDYEGTGIGLAWSPSWRATAGVRGPSESTVEEPRVNREDSRGEVATGSVHPQREWEVRPHEEITTAYVRAALEAVGGNMRKAARMLQISPSTLYAKLRETPNAE